jgi:hypothetical protein
VRFDPFHGNSQKMKSAIPTCEDGNAEMWCKWQEQLNELYQLVVLKIADHKAKAVIPLFHGKPLA